MRWFWEKKKMDTLHTLNGKPLDAPTSSGKESLARMDGLSDGGLQVKPAPAAAPPVPMIFPVGDPTVTATANAVKTQVHRAECGDVGIVGEVGDLGSNAKGN
jgi:hypothetical protein